MASVWLYLTSNYSIILRVVKFLFLNSGVRIDDSAFGLEPEWLSASFLWSRMLYHVT